jgi:hypothetical protein
MRIATLFAIPLIALSIALWPSAASAQAKAKNQMLPNGTVKSVSGTSVVVTALGKDTTFAVDGKTKVVGKGIGTKSAAKGGKPTIIDLVKEGDRVTVTYQDMGGTMHASTIEVAAKSVPK